METSQKNKERLRLLKIKSLKYQSEGVNIRYSETSFASLESVNNILLTVEAESLLEEMRSAWLASKKHSGIV